MIHTEIAMMMGAFAFVFLYLTFRLGHYKLYVLPTLLIGMFAINFSIKYIFSMSSWNFYFVHTFIVLAIVGLSEYFYRKRKEDHHIKANLVPIVGMFYFVGLSVLRRVADFDTFVFVHSFFTFLIMVFLIVAPYLSKKYPKIKQFYF